MVNTPFTLSGLEMEFLPVPPGNLNDQTRFHHPFWITRTPITLWQWERIFQPHPQRDRMRDPNCPVTFVHSLDAEKYCQALNQLIPTFPNIPENGQFRLPLELEWEYTCRAGTDTVFFFGNNGSNIGEYAWYNENSSDEIQEVGKKRPNPWGFQDMLGLVWEWTAEEYFEQPRRYDDSVDALDLPSPLKFNERCVRGGSFQNTCDSMTSGNRGHNWWNVTSDDLGFRVGYFLYPEN